LENERVPYWVMNIVPPLVGYPRALQKTHGARTSGGGTSAHRASWNAASGNEEERTVEENTLPLALGPNGSAERRQHGGRCSHLGRGESIGRSCTIQAPRRGAKSGRREADHSLRMSR